MPANLTPQYLEAEAEFKQAKTAQEKLACLEKMLAFIPKHKGTDKLQADIKRKIKKIKELEEKKRASAPKRVSLFNVKKEGAGSIALVGFPNTGKSSLLCLVTNASSAVAEYPFTTTAPVPGMMDYEDINLQLIDLPPISEEYIEYDMLNLIRKVELVLLMTDLSSNDLLDQIEFIIEKFRSSKIELEKKDANPQINWTYKNTVIAANKFDLPESGNNLKILQEFYGKRFAVSTISCLNGAGIEELKKLIFEKCGIIRVYSKPPGKEEDLRKPYALKKGSTVLDAAAVVHKDIAKNLKYARIWGSGKYQGQMVERSHILADKDIIELHN